LRHGLIGGREMQPRASIPAQKLASAALIVTSFLSVLVFDLPGHLSNDSVLQLLEGRTGVYGGWHPPLMSWLLGLADAVAPGAGLFVCFNAALFFGSLFSLLWTRPRVSWAAVPAIVLCCSLPQILIYQGIVWKDVLFANAAIAGFICLAHAGERWANARLRFSLIGLGFLLFALAALTRQNGLVMPLVGVAALTLLAHRQAGEKTRIAPLAYGLGALCGLAAFLFAAHAALQTRVRGDDGTAAQLTALQAYDIAGALQRQPSLDLAEFRRADPALETYVRATWPANYSLRWVDTLEDTFHALPVSSPVFAAAVQSQWGDLVTRHTPLYLHVRLTVFRWVFLTPHMADDVCLPYSLGVSGAREDMRALGIGERWTATDDALDDYASGFLGTPLMSHATYAVLAFLALAILAGRRRPADMAIASMLVAALLFASSFFFISISCDYRYLYALDLSALTALVYLSMDFDASALARRLSRIRRAASP
jgi:hypothetical protein